MEIHQIRYFLAVAKQGNFTRAAEACHVSQPTLSHQIKKLEEELGEMLLVRSRKHSRMTPFGEAFFPRAQRMITELEAALHDASEFRGRARGHLRIGAIPTIAPYLLPGLVAGVHAAYPQFEITLYEEPTLELIRLLEEGTVQFALLSPDPKQRTQYAMRDLDADELCLAMPPGHPLENPRTLHLKELEEYSLVLMKEAHCLSQQTLDLCSLAGLSPHIAIRSSQLDTVAALVQTGFGVSIIPAMAIPSMKHRNLVFRSFKPRKITRPIAVAWLQGTALTAAQQAFLESL